MLFLMLPCLYRHQLYLSFLPIPDREKPESFSYISSVGSLIISPALSHYNKVLIVRSPLWCQVQDRFPTFGMCSLEPPSIHKTLDTLFDPSHQSYLSLFQYEFLFNNFHAVSSPLTQFVVTKSCHIYKSHKNSKGVGCSPGAGTAADLPTSPSPEERYTL